MKAGNGKVLLAGDWAWDIYEEALGRGFEGHGWDVIPFCTGSIATRFLPALWRLRPSWSVADVNRALLETASELRPDLVFLWRCIDILPETIRSLRIRVPSVKVVGYHNDNPFSTARERFRWRHFLRGLREVDVAAVYRPSNIAAALALGAPRVEVLPPSFIRSLHRPVVSVLRTQVIYVGHFEDDGRLDALNALYKAGVAVTVRGTGWEQAQTAYEWLAEQPIQELRGEDYVAALSGARIALAFLSGKNGDPYTRRCFEIPACGSLLVAPRTTELRNYFCEDHEAVFWSAQDELVGKVKALLSNEVKRSTIAAAGRVRVLRDRHDEFGRAMQVLGWFDWGSDSDRRGADERKTTLDAF